MQLATCQHRRPIKDEPNLFQCRTNRFIVGGPVTLEICRACPVANLDNLTDPYSYFGIPRQEYVSLMDVINAAKRYQTLGGRCISLGKSQNRMMPCGACGGPAVAESYDCSHPTLGPNTNHYRCVTCPGYKPVVKWLHKDGDPTVGVVIGSYHWPRLIALQALVIRDTCGPLTPILVSDDGSNEEQSKLLKIICKIVKIDLIQSEDRMGHLWGDTTAYKRGIEWAKEKGVQVLAKLSQRFIVKRPRWLQDFGAELLASGRSTSGQRCRHKNIRFGFRSECCLLNVDQWHREDILKFLSPEGGQIGGENTITDAINLIGTGMKRLRLFTPDRFAHYHDDVLWHHWDNNEKCGEAYRALAAEYGIALDPDFQCGRPAGS